MTGPARSPGELAAATARDRCAELHAGMSQLDCRRCAGRVWVKKNSRAHTSIQWTADAARRCSAYAPEHGCPHLRSSVDTAVAEGALPVPEEPVDEQLVPPGG